MHAVLRSLHSPHLDPDALNSYVPPIADDFGVLVAARIGPNAEEGEELFYVTVCSPTWLARATMTDDAKGYEFVRHRLVLGRWDPQLLRRAVSDLCLHASGSEWSEVATKLSRYLYWESEDYTP